MHVSYIHILRCATNIINWTRIFSFSILFSLVFFCCCARVSVCVMLWTAERVERRAHTKTDSNFVWFASLVCFSSFAGRRFSNISVDRRLMYGIFGQRVNAAFHPDGVAWWPSECFLIIYILMSVREFFFTVCQLPFQTASIPKTHPFFEWQSRWTVNQRKNVWAKKKKKKKLYECIEWKRLRFLWYFPTRGDDESARHFFKIFCFNANTMLIFFIYWVQRRICRRKKKWLRHHHHRRLISIILVAEIHANHNNKMNAWEPTPFWAQFSFPSENQIEPLNLHLNFSVEKK